MFAVPGWAVSADSLKTQTQNDLKKTSADPPQANELNGESQKKKSRKRKRIEDKPDNVTSENLADLWSKHVERHDTGKTPNHVVTKLAKSEKKKHSERPHDDTRAKETNKTVVKDADAKSKKSREEPEKKIKSKRNKTSQDETVTASQTSQASDTSKPSKAIDLNSSQIAISSAPVPSASTTSKLTPLQSTMRQKLISSRFRYLNETLYTTPSSSSLELFKQNPTFFSEYHEGFRRQVTAWPENPVEGFFRWTVERGRARGKDLGSQKAQFRKDGKGKKSAGPRSNNAPPNQADEGLEPLPRNNRSGICTIVDLGCGDAQLAEKLTATPPKPPLIKALKLQVHSYDLAANSPLVTVADIRSLPLQEGSVDIAIFSLALMGTNWIDFIEEAYRVLRWKGECWISEVGSRFAAVNKKGRVAHSVGNRTKDKDGGKGKKTKKDDGATSDDDFDTVEEVTDKSQINTDVSAFTAVLKRRGFVLQGEPELGNKMFVRMRFIKAAPALVGKCVRAQPTPETRVKRFVEQEDSKEISVEEEAKVLKPCVYKIR